MNKKSFWIFVLCLIMVLNTVSSACAQSDPYTVYLEKTGYANVPFSNGYKGYCIDHTLKTPGRGASFRELDTSHARRNNPEQTPIGQYLKILFVENADVLFEKDADGNFIPISTDNIISLMIWAFSDYDYETSSNPMVREAIRLKENGMTVPDTGMEPIRFDENTLITFDFMMLDAEDPTHNSFFAYRINAFPAPDEPTAPDVPDAPAPSVPVTGDDAPLALWAALAGVSLAGMMLITRRRRSAN